MNEQLANLHPVLWWLFATAAVSVAIGAIWRVWLGSVVATVRDAIESAIEIVELLRDIRGDMGAMKTCIENVVEELRTYAGMLDDHNTRIERVERELELRK